MLLDDLFAVRCRTAGLTMTRTLDLGHMAHHYSLISIVKRSARCPQDEDSKKGRSNMGALWIISIKDCGLAYPA